MKNNNLKDNNIICRVKEQEKRMVEEEAKKRNLSISQLIRLMINDYIINNNSLGNSSMIPKNICNLHTEIQRLRNEYPNLDLDELERRAEKLW